MVLGVEVRAVKVKVKVRAQIQVLLVPEIVLFSPIK